MGKAMVGDTARTSRLLGRMDRPSGNPSGGVAYVAAFLCAGTERIGREVGFPLAVIAATADPDRHAKRLSVTRHAAWTPREGGADAIALDDASGLASEFAYRQLAFDRRWLGPATLPAGVGLDRGALTVELPSGASVEDLSALLCSGLSDHAFESVARQPDRVRHRFATRRPVVVAPRYASLVRDGTAELFPVDNLFRFRPRDLAELASALALAIASLGLVTRVSDLTRAEPLMHDDGGRPEVRQRGRASEGSGRR